MRMKERSARGDDAPVAARSPTHKAEEEETGHGNAKEMRLILFC